MQYTLGMYSSKSSVRKSLSEWITSTNDFENLKIISLSFDPESSIFHPDWSCIILIMDGQNNEKEDFLKNWYQQTLKPSIVLSPQLISEKTNQYFQLFGAVTLPIPFSKLELAGVLKGILSSSIGFNQVSQQNLALHSEINEFKLVQKAKRCLMDYLQLSEQKAHRYIQKQAMERQCSKSVIALEILQTYDDRPSLDRS